MTDIRLVSSNEAIIKRIQDGNWTEAELIRESGLPRGVVRGLIRDYGQEKKKRIKIRGPRRPPIQSAPPLPNSQNNAGSLLPERPQTRGADTVTRTLTRTIDQWILAGLIGLVGYGMGGVGVVINWNFAFSYGRTPMESYLLAFLAAGMDFCAVLLPSGMVNSLKAHRYGAAMVAFLVWVPCQSFSIVSGYGFSGDNIGATLYARSADAQRTADLKAELQALRAQREAIKEDRDAKVIEQLMLLAWGRIDTKNLKASNNCDNATSDGSAVVCAPWIQLKAARDSAIRRDTIDTKMADLSAQIAARPAVTSSLPENIETLRKAGLSGAATLVAGVLVAISRMLVAR
jgi:hypothetical protein